MNSTVTRSPGIDARVMDYTQLRAAATAAGATYFARPEDAAWDKANPNIAYFVTTSFSRLFRLTFDNIARPTDGGTIEILIDNGAGNKLFLFFYFLFSD